MALTIWLSCAILLMCQGSAAFMNPAQQLRILSSERKTDDCRVDWKGTQGLRTASRRNGLHACTMIAASPAPSSLQSGPLKRAFKKPSGALTVAVQYAPETELTDVAIQWLSMQLRRQKASAIFAEKSVAVFCSEQAGAKGNFPGPVPIVSSAKILSIDDVDAAKKFGAGGVVIMAWSPADTSADATALEAARKIATHAASQGIEAIWEVHNGAQVDAAVQAGAQILLLNCSGGAAETAALRASIPRDRVAIARVAAMQAAAALHAAGVDGVLLAGACVGDDEDAEYVRWAVETLSSKASKEFRITGMTGHVNGHFGTGTFERATGERQWRRRGASVWAPASTNAAGRKSASAP